MSLESPHQSPDKRATNGFTPPTSQRELLGIDVGGTLIKGLVATEADIVDAGTRPPVLRRPTEVHRGIPAIIDNITALAETLIADAAARGHIASGLGLAVPGLVDEAEGVAVNATNIGWQDVPLASIIAERLGMSVVLRHDVRSGALAELRCGAARHYRNFVFLPVGTGIACGIVCNERPYRGEHFRAGEIGHIRVSASTDACACGRTGCLETVSSAAAIARRYQRETGQLDVSTEQVVAAAQANDTVAREIWTNAMDGLAEAILASNTLLDIDHYVIGGGLTLAGDALMSDLSTAIAKFPHEGPRPVVELSVLGADAGVIGAALAITDTLHDNVPHKEK